MDPAAAGTGMSDEDLELQMALALSLQEVHASQLGEGEAPSRQAHAGPSDQPSPLMQPAAHSAGNLVGSSHSQGASLQTHLQSLLAQAFSGAAVPAVPAVAPTSMPAGSTARPSSAAPTPAQPVPSHAAGSNAASELARQLALFQQAMSAGVPTPPTAPIAPVSYAAQSSNSAPTAAAGGNNAPAATAPVRTGATQHSARPAAATPVSTPPPKAPAWASSLQSWWTASASPDAAGRATVQDISLASNAELQQLCEVLSKALGIKVDAGASSMAVQPGKTPSLLLKSSSTPAGHVTVRAADVTALVQQWLSRPSMAVSGVSQLRALANAAAALPVGSQGLSANLQPAVQQLLALLGSIAFQLLSKDEADLYYERGVHTTELLRDLKKPGSFPLQFLEAIAGAVHDAPAADALARLLGTVFAEFKSIKQLGMSALEMDPLENAVAATTSSLSMIRCLASQLLHEAVQAGGPPPPAGAGRRHAVSPAQAMEARSILTPALQLSSLVDPVATLRTRTVQSRALASFKALKSFSGLPHNEGEVNSNINMLGSLQSKLQQIIHESMMRIVRVKEGGLAGREAVLVWLAAAARLNWERVLSGEKGISGQIEKELSAGASDAWCVNLTAVALRFAQPFVSGYWSKKGPFVDLFDKHLSPSYYATHPHRLPDLQKINSLAGERGQSVGDAVQQLPADQRSSLVSSSSSSAPWLEGPAPGAAGAASFTADCFFLAQTWLHVGLLPALHRYHRLNEALHSGLMAEQSAGKDPKARSPLMEQLILLSSCERAALLETGLVERSVAFCLLQISWLHHLLSKPNAPAMFALIPDYTLTDPLNWLQFILTSGLAVHVASMDISALTSALAALLDNRACVRSPVLAEKTARLLLAMLSPQLSVSRRAEFASDKGSTRGMLAATVQRPGEAALAAAVLNSPASQSGSLVAALMRAYVAADHVVGLDVDRDAFDKFSMRNSIDAILEEFWRDDRGRRCLLNLASTATAADHKPAQAAASHVGTFDDYVSCLFNSLIYLFKDSLDRLVDISKVEAAKHDTAGWAARPKSEQDNQESFLHSTAQTCRGFMRYAVQALNWLYTLAEHPQTGAALCRAPLSGRVAYSVLHFMELLSSTRAQQLLVDRPEQYLWDRPALLCRVVGLATRLVASSEGPAFVAALAAEPDLDMAVLQEVNAQLEANHQVGEATRLTRLIDSLHARVTPARRHARASDDNLATATGQPPVASPNGAPPPAKRSRLEVGGDTSMEAASNLAGAPASDVDMADTSSSTAATGAEWCLPGTELTGPELVSQYKEQLAELQLGTFDAGASRAYHSAFNAMAADTAATHAPAMMKRVAKEVRDMSSKTPLPCEPAASIFVRYDGEQMHKMRALITGPEGTPYAYGCFVFDLLFPPGYPNTPMLVNFETTGQGRARFNPNLYADGKVCLSLINTWHASHESEKWNPDRTSTFQVLVSIQAMILVEDPYYNEPAHEATRGTDTGQSSAAMYNAQLTLNFSKHTTFLLKVMEARGRIIGLDAFYPDLFDSPEKPVRLPVLNCKQRQTMAPNDLLDTLRWTMIDKIKSPPPGLEAVVHTHFKLLRHKVMAQAARWLQAAQTTGDEQLIKRMHAALQELHGLLLAL